jgi:hypothetical protein
MRQVHNLFLTLLAAGLLLVACGDAAQTEEGAATQKAAILGYCDKNGIDIPELTVSGDDGFGDKPTVSKENPSWQIDYAFPAEAEGEGQFFLLHKTDAGWTVVAHTDKGQVGWTADELKGLGAPTDIVLDPTQ